MKFLIDRCTGSLLAKWLRSQGHDVVDAADFERDPGDRVLLEWAASESRILITNRHRFRPIGFPRNVTHHGLIRLPDVPASERIRIVEDILTRFAQQLKDAAIITVRGDRIRISRFPE